VDGGTTCKELPAARPIVHRCRTLNRHPEPRAPAYQVWAAPIVLAVITVAGLAYLALAKPHRRL
jgi:hypothetical protein